MDDIFENLDEATMKTAREELNEDEKNRDGAIETLVDLIKQQNWLKTPTDKSFLLRFLRMKKFSQLEARKSLAEYWRARSAVPEWFKDRDPRDEKILNVIRKGAIVVLPKADKFGRRYLLLKFGALDPASIKNELGGADGVFRAVLVVMDWMTMDPRVQINGTVVIADLTGYTLQHKMILHTSQNMKKYTAVVMSNPTRVKSINMYNMPPVYEAVFMIIKAFMKQKIRDRVKTHGRTLVSLYDNIDKSVLPKEYLPDDYTGHCSGTIDEILANIMEEIVKPEVVEYIRNLSSVEYGVDSKLKPSDSDVPSASFRKLNVD